MLLVICAHEGHSGAGNLFQKATHPLFHNITEHLAQWCLLNPGSKELLRRIDAIDHPGPGRYAAGYEHIVQEELQGYFGTLGVIVAKQLVGH